MTSIKLEHPLQEGEGKRKRDDDVKDDQNDDSIDTLNSKSLMKEEEDEDTNEPVDGGDDTDDNGDSSDDDENEDYEYSESMEDFPDEAAFDSEVPQVKSGCETIAGEVELLFKESGCVSESAKNFRAKAAELKSFPDAKPIKVGMLGATGVGKSATTSALADKPGLAKEGASGRACTCVPTILRRPFLGQNEQFAAKLHYLDDESIRELLREQLENYVHWKFRADVKATDEDAKTSMDRCDTAMTTLRALFNDTEEFQSDHAAHAFMDEYQDDIDGALDVMMEWCEILLDTEDDGDGNSDEPETGDEDEDADESENDGSEEGSEHSEVASDEDAEESDTKEKNDNPDQSQPNELENDETERTQYFEEISAKKLRKSIDPQMCSKAKYTQPTMWPLVNQADLGIRGPRVLEHLAIGDLPGITDTNKLRVNMTLEYLKDCDALWIVARIDRVVTDPTVASLVHDLLQKYGDRFAGRVAIICTRSDDVGDLKKQAEDLKDEDYDLGDFSAKYKMWKEAERKATKADKDLSRPSKKRKQNENDAIAEKARQEGLRDTYQKELHTQIVGLRNHSVTAQLQDKYRDYMPPGCELQVFCISNKHYAAAKGADSPLKPCLDIDATNIPALRSYALSLAAPTLLRNLESFVNHKFGVFVRGLDLFAHGSSVKSPDELRKIVDRPRDIIDPATKRFVDDTKIKINEVIKERFGSEQTAMVKAATKEIEDWNKWHWCSIRSFVRKYGTSQTSLVPKKSWNRRFLAHATQEVIRPGFIALREHHKTQFQSIAEEITAALCKLLEELNYEPDAVALPLVRFAEIIREHIGAVNTIVDACQRDYNRELENIKIKATGSDHDAYFSQAMKECYDFCNALSGKGYKGKVISHFHTHVTLTAERSPFHATGEAIAKALVENARSCAKRLAKELKGILKEVNSAFEAMISNKADDPSEIPVRKQLAEYLQRKQPEIEKLKQAVEGIKLKYQVDVKIKKEQ